MLAFPSEPVVECFGLCLLPPRCNCRRHQTGLSPRQNPRRRPWCTKVPLVQRSEQPDGRSNKIHQSPLWPHLLTISPWWSSTTSPGKLQREVRVNCSWNWEEPLCRWSYQWRAHSGKGRNNQVSICGDICQKNIWVAQVALKHEGVGESVFSNSLRRSNIREGAVGYLKEGGSFSTRSAVEQGLRHQRSLPIREHWANKARDSQ